MFLVVSDETFAAVAVSTKQVKCGIKISLSMPHFYASKMNFERKQITHDPMGGPGVI
jgi:hypothetical protein